MVKECQVVKNNDTVTVAKFDQTYVQFPSIHKDTKTVHVSYDGKNYFIVDKKDKQSVKTRSKNKNINKTTPDFEPKNGLLSDVKH